MAASGPGAANRMDWGRVLTRQDTRPPCIVLHAANLLRATEIRRWGHDTATVRWHPPEDGAAQLAEAHFNTGGPVYDDALSRLGDTQGPLLPMLSTDLAAALRQELDGCEGLRVGSDAVADGTLLALLHRDAGNGCEWDTLAPHLTGRHVYMATPHQGHPCPAWDDLIAAFHDHGTLRDDMWREVQRKRLGRDYGRRVRARLLGIWDPLRQRWDDLWLRHLDPWSPPSHLPHTCRLCEECDTVSSAASTGANRPGMNLPRARAGARRRRPCTGALRGHTPPHTNTQAPRALPLYGSMCTCGTRHPLRTCGTCSHPDPHPPPPSAEPAVPCHADGGMGRDTPGPAAKHRRRSSRGLVADAVAEAHEAHAAARCDPTGSARAFLNKTALPAVRALNGPGAPTLLSAMHRIVNAIQPGLICPEAALYGHWMEWRESNRSGRPLSMGDTLRLTGAGSAVSLRSRAAALLHALRTRYPWDTAPYLNRARATYPGGLSELDAALHLLHSPDEDLGVGGITMFVEGAE